MENGASSSCAADGSTVGAMPPIVFLDRMQHQTVVHTWYIPAPQVVEAQTREEALEVYSQRAKLFRCCERDKQWENSDERC